MIPTVSVTIVTYNSERFIGGCLDALFRQDGVPFEVIIVDNASTDATRSALARHATGARMLYNDRNVGFAAAQNQAIGISRGRWVLTLNPDVLLKPGFLRHAVEAGESEPEIGSVCGKLLAIGDGFRPLERRLIDSAGIYFTPYLRHFDRGWHEPDDGRFDRPEYVFGATGAAALYRREMIEDVSLDDGFLDPDFFVYREDADVAWRAQLLGWRCLYTPRACGYHVRRVVPGSRRSLPAVINMHSVKNRFLMRIKNTTGDLYRRYWLTATLRDLTVLGGCLLLEPRSLPAFWLLARCLPRAWKKRRAIMRRRRADDASIARWFCSSPASLPIPEPIFD